MCVLRLFFQILTSIQIYCHFGSAQCQEIQFLHFHLLHLLLHLFKLLFIYYKDTFINCLIEKITCTGLSLGLKVTKSLEKSTSSTELMYLQFEKGFQICYLKNQTVIKFALYYHQYRLTNLNFQIYFLLFKVGLNFRTD